jgi:hypothetical protein
MIICASRVAVLISLFCIIRQTTDQGDRRWQVFHPSSSWVHSFPFSCSAEALRPDVFATVAGGDQEVGRIFDE